MVDAACSDGMFDYCVSNPPYQIIVNAHSGASRQITRDIFPEFQICASVLAQNTSMIYPSTWQKRTDAGLGKFLVDNGLESTDNYNGSDLFPGIESGFPVSTVVTSRGYEGDITCNGLDCSRDSAVFFRNEAVKVIYERTRDVVKITPGVHDFCKINNAQSSGLQFADSPDGMDTPVLFYIKRAPGTQADAKFMYVERADIEDHIIYPNGLNEYQVSFQSGMIGRVKHFNDAYYGSRNIIRRIYGVNEGHGMTHTVMRSFITREQAENFLKYMNTTVFMHLLSLDFSKKSFGAFIPDLGDYTDSNPDINWDEPLDDQLYEMFGLTDEEIDIVRSHSHQFRWA